jgi:hypothetical protein
MLEMEGTPGISREQFLKNSVDAVLKDSIDWQVAALRAGFSSVITSDMLRQWEVTPWDMQEMVCGSRDDKVRR